MDGTDFNLLDEPWIRVMNSKYEITEISLMDVLIHSHDYLDFAGELDAQNIAVLRLCLAVLHTVFYRYNVDGEYEDLEDAEMARNRWEDLWKEGHFPETVIRQYFEQYKERFWLFHPDKPFYQVNEAKKGTEYTAAKLNGEISESSNKTRMFAVRGGKAKSQLTYAEAARWLLFINGFDDTSAKPRQKGLPSPGAGWLGKLGLVEAVGNNLFETLMLNLVFERLGDIWTDVHPVWEKEPKGEERSKIPTPNNPVDLFTLQSRRLLLKRNEGMVTGYYLLGGDFFPKENVFAETMTAWTPIPQKKNEFQPKRHDPNKQVWREFGNLFWEDDEDDTLYKKRPGVVSWISALKSDGLLEDIDNVTFRTVAVQYGDKDFFIADTFSDSLTIHSDLLKKDKWMIWGERIKEEVTKCEEIARIVGDLAKRLNLSVGIERSGEDAKAEFYRQIDLPFRGWLEQINSKEGREDVYKNPDKACEAWHQIAQATAKNLGDRLIENLGPAAFAGRKVEGKDKTFWYCCAPKAYNSFSYCLARVYKK